MRFAINSSFSNVFVPALLLLLALRSATATPPSDLAKDNNNTDGKAQCPQSVFTIPTSPKEGRDPFFPNSVRVYASVKPVDPSPVLQNIPLIWHGISGTPENRLVMINGETFGKGDELTVTVSNSSRVRVKCIEIASDSVIIEAAGTRRVLHLRPGL